MTRYGISLSSFDQPLLETRSLVELLPDLGYSDLWSGENYTFDAFTPLVAASIWAPTARLGLGMMQAYTRGPAIMAMSIAALCQMAPGRVVVGIGSSTRTIVEDWNAVPYEKPYARVRDTIRFLRAALAGEKVDEEYESFRVNGFRLRAKVEQPPPIVIGAVRPRMLALSGELGDGAQFANVSAEDVKQLIPHVKAKNPEAEIMCSVYVAPSRDAEKVRERARWVQNEYMNSPTYAAAQRERGHASELRESWDRWSAGDRKGAAAAIPDAMIDSLVVHGSGEECREKLQRYFENGVDTVVIELLDGVADPKQAVRELAPR